MKKLIYLFFALFFIACNTKIERVYQDVEVIRASAVYNHDTVANFIEKFSDKNKELSEAYLKQANDAGDNNLLKATFFTKRAVTLNPSLENYTALAKILSKSEKYKELSTLYYFLTTEHYKKVNNEYEPYFIFGKPDEDIYYEFLATQLINNNYLNSYDIYKVKEQGFNVSDLKSKLFSDKRITIDMTTEEAKKMMLMFLTDSELESYSKLESTFKEYLASIKDVSPVFEISLDNVNKFYYENFNGINGYDMDYEESDIISNIDRKYLQENIDGWLSYNLNHYIDINDHVKAVVYAVDSSETACPINMRHIYHRLITYDNSANILDSKIIAYQLGNKVATANFNRNKFSITEYKRNWKKEYVKMQYGNDFDNDLLSTNQVKVATFEIKDDGKIIELLN